MWIVRPCGSGKTRARLHDSRAHSGFLPVDLPLHSGAELENLLSGIGLGIFSETLAWTGFITAAFWDLRKIWIEPGVKQFAFKFDCVVSHCLVN